MPAMKNRRMWIIIAAIIAVMCVTVGVILWQYYVLQSSIVIDDTADYYAFNPVDSLSGVEIDDVNCTEYNVDISEMDEEEIADLLYSDFTAESVKGDIDINDHFEQDVDLAQVFLLSHTDYQQVWIINPVLGGQTVLMMNKTNDLNGIAFETDGGSFTLNQTNDDEWTFSVKADWIGVGLSATEEDKDYPKGLPGSNYDFENDCFNFNVIRIQFNETASHTYAEIAGNYDEVVNGVYAYFYFLDDWTSEDFSSYTCDFGASMGVSLGFEVIGVSWGYGNLDSSVTIYDTQN